MKEFTRKKNLSTFSLSNRFSLGHVSLIIKREHHGSTSIHEKVAHDRGSKLGSYEISPGLDALRLHQLDLSINKTRFCGQCQLSILKRARRLLAEQLHPFRVDRHGDWVYIRRICQLQAEYGSGKQRSSAQ